MNIFGLVVGVVGVVVGIVGLLYGIQSDGKRKRADAARGIAQSERDDAQGERDSAMKALAERQVQLTEALLASHDESQKQAMASILTLRQGTIRWHAQNVELNYLITNSGASSPAVRLAAYRDGDVAAGPTPDQPVPRDETVTFTITLARDLLEDVRSGDRLKPGVTIRAFDQSGEAWFPEAPSGQ